ncbi:MAG TPA: hypothetical protein VMR31_09000 [Myxococcota bacterium]|nr:hypothetical protein [Myxococcota bacterium]
MALQALKLENRALACAVLPELGGKLSSLVNGATGREWLWTNPSLPRVRAEPGDSYVEKHDTGGIDDCFPEVHGTVYGRPWIVAAHGERELALAFEGEGWRFARRLRLHAEAPRLELSYEVENRSKAELPFVWCLHALFATEPGMRIELPEATPIRVAVSHGAPAGAELFAVPPAAAKPFAAKLFAGPFARGEAALHYADRRESLRIRFDAPFLGIWLNHGRWSGRPDLPPYRNLALEPSIGDADALSEALARGTAGRLAAGARRSWSIGIELGPWSRLPGAGGSP